MADKNIIDKARLENFSDGSIDLKCTTLWLVQMAACLYCPKPYNS